MLNSLSCGNVCGALQGRGPQLEEADQGHDSAVLSELGAGLGHGGHVGEQRGGLLLQEDGAAWTLRAHRLQHHTGGPRRQQRPHGARLHVAEVCERGCG